MVQNTRMTSHSIDRAAPENPGPQDQLGRPMRDLRISLLDRCNFRCPYCMPESTYNEDYQFLRRQQRLSFDEIVRFASIAVSLGVNKLRLTGGEPLLDKGVPELVGRLAALPGVDDLALTTNGTLLERFAVPLADAGLNRVTVSLDSIDADIFRNMSGNRGDVETVLNGIAAAGKAGLMPVKINTVVQRGVNEHAVLDVLEYFRDTGHVVRLIEFMDVGNRNGWRLDQVVPSRELLEQINARWPVEAVGRNYQGRQW